MQRQDFTGGTVAYQLCEAPKKGRGKRVPVDFSLVAV